MPTFLYNVSAWFFFSLEFVSKEPILKTYNVFGHAERIIKMGKKVVTKNLILLLLMVFFSGTVDAHFEFSPITMSLSTIGKGTHAIAQVSNKENFQVPIVVRVTERKLLENGEEERPETNDIAVFPSQFLLEPKETRSIKITWQGDEKLAAEKAYRIFVEEIPVEFSAKTANRGAVKILINYIGSIYVNSDKTDGDLVLNSINSEDGKNLNFQFVNKGTSHVIIKSPSIELTAKSTGKLPGKKLILDKLFLSSAEGKNVLALSKLNIKIPTPSELNGYENFEWKFTFDK